MELVEERFTFGDLDLVVIRPGNPADLIDEERFAADEYMPYWAEVWPAGVELARHVAGLDVSGLAVLELGCGLGLPSLVAALHGARVTATDWAADALDALAGNAERNGARLETLVLDWRDVSVLAGARFDLVMAADVLYEERNAAPLLDVLAAALTCDGVAIVSDPGRKHAEGFPELAAAAGFRTDELPRGPQAGPGRILRLRRAGVIG